MLYILSGPDDYSLTQTLDEIKKEVGSHAVLGEAATTLDGPQVTLDRLQAACQTAPFLMGKRLVVIRGLLGRFDPKKGRASRQKKTAETAQTDEARFAACLTQIPDSTVVVLVEDSLASSNPLLKALLGKAVVKSFPLLRGDELTQWVQKRVKSEGGSISPQAVALLAKLVGSNLWTMASEITKLALFADGRRIEEEDVKTIVSYTQEANVFAMVDAILEFKVTLAGELLQRLLRSGAAPVYLLFMLSRQVGMIVRAKELKTRQTADLEIQRKLGLTAEFVLRKTLAQAGRYSLARLKQVYRQLLETDLAIKTGKYDAELALEILVVELCQPELKEQSIRREHCYL